MASNCDLWCFIQCASAMNVSSGDPIQISNDLESMAWCMNHGCQSNYPDKNITELANVYNQQLLAGNAFINETFDPTNCTFNRPTESMYSDWLKHFVPILGYLFPIIIFLTIISNSLVIIVLMKPHMRSPTNAILVAMALSDLFTGLSPLPVYLHFFAAERLYEWMPYNWCYAHIILLNNLPGIFHATSIWLTVALTVQRYICVCHPFKARTWCTTRRIIYVIVVIYVVATLTYIPRFFDFYLEQVEVPSLLNPEQNVSSCVYLIKPFLENDFELYENVFSGYWLIFVTFLPCVGLIVMNALLIRTLRIARIRRRQLLGQHKNRESRKLEESDRTTLILVVVVCIFLLIEIPTMGYVIFFVIELNIDITNMDADTRMFWSFFNDIFNKLAFPLNLFIYCSICKRFRDTFKQMFVCSCRLSGKDSQYRTCCTKKRNAVTGDTIDESAL